MNCYYCDKEFQKAAKATIASKWFDDGNGMWSGKEHYPNGLAHIACEDTYRAKAGKPKAKYTEMESSNV